MRYRRGTGATATVKGANIYAAAAAGWYGESITNTLAIAVNAMPFGFTLATGQTFTATGTGYAAFLKAM